MFYVLRQLRQVFVAYFAAAQPVTGSNSAEAPRSIWYPVGTRSRAGASTWPVPGLRAKRGCAPPAIWSRIRWPGAKLVGHAEERHPDQAVVRGPWW